MQRERVILHVDINACFASIEELYHPEVRGKPMAVCGDEEHRRGVILAKNELAKRRGVKTGESTFEAMRKCPELVKLPAHHDLYEHYSKRANEICLRYTDLVEPASIDEAYLDVTGSGFLFGSGETIANEIRRSMREELGLTVSVGVSFCKVFAKMGSDYKKPDATTVITRENFRELLYPLPVTELMYVGEATAKNLAVIGVHTIGQLAGVEEELLVTRLGKHGHGLWANVHGLDDEPVRIPPEQEEAKSIGRGITFRRNLISLEDIRTALSHLTDAVAERLRQSGVKCGGVQLSIKNTELKVIDRQMQLAYPTDTGRELFTAALGLLQRSWRVGDPIRMLTVTAIHLNSEEQESLFARAGEQERLRSLDRSVDRVRGKYGARAVQQASLLKNDLGLDE